MSFASVWARWKELTRFRLACEMALSSYRKSFLELPIRNISAAKISDERGNTRFECSYSDFLQALSDETHLYRLLIVAHTSLIEEFGRVVVAQILDDKLATRTVFKGMQTIGTNLEAAEAYIMQVNVETWGAALLKLARLNLEDILEYQGALVHAVVIRNIVGHGANYYNPAAINRINGVKPGHIAFGAGHPLTLDREEFLRHLSSLRNFGRVTCSALSHLRQTAKRAAIQRQGSQSAANVRSRGFRKSH